VTLGSSAASVTFSSIPATYRDLVLIANSNNSNGALDIRFNSDSGTNYSRVVAYAPSPTSFSQTGNTAILLNSPASGEYLQTLQVMDYSATDKHKTALERGSNASVIFMGAHRWANTAAITTMSLTATGGLFTIGSNFSLYGVIA
jgi:hypothetical protein